MTEPPAPHDWHGFPANSYNPHAWFVGAPEIGEGCWIGAFTVVDGSGGLVIGAGCEISAGAQIYTHSTVRRVITDAELPSNGHRPRSARTFTSAQADRADGL